MSAARPRAVIFDWDNTLVDSWGTIHTALCETFATMGHAPWSFAETKARVRHSLRDAFPRLFGERWDEARQLYLNRFTAIHLDRLTALVGAEQMLQGLVEERIYIAVASNKTGAILRREADHLGWTPYFGRLVGAGDAATDKPSPAPVALALAGSGIGIDVGAVDHSIWYVGDTALDMECAANAGCRGVLLGDDSDDEGYATFPPALRFPSATELLDHIRGL